MYSTPQITPANPNKPELGAVISNIDLHNLSDETFTFLRDALYTYNVVCIKSQGDLTPREQAEISRKFDPNAAGYGHGKTMHANKSVLAADLKTVPDQPEVQIIGNGHIAVIEGLKDITLKHPHHKSFHKTAIPDELDKSHTRFYRWHIDAALYGKMHPPMVTSLLAVDVPEPRTQTLLYDDGTNETLEVPWGTTAFASGYEMFDLLSPEQKDFVLTSKIEYAPHPYIWMSSAKSFPTGLGMISEGKEVPIDALPPVENESDIQVLPMAWQNPVTKQFALQIHPSAIRKIHLKDGSVIDDLLQVRKIVYDLQRPGIAPELVYAHDWQKGDFVIFNNHGVLHSVVGAFQPDEIRLFRQCNMAGSQPPVGPSMVATAA